MAFISPVTYIVARPILSWELLRSLAPLAMVNVLNVVCGLVGARGGHPCGAAAARVGLPPRRPASPPPSRRPAGTAGLNVPMFIALRRFTLLFTILLERYWLKKVHDWPTLSAMGIMIGGAVIAAATDLTFNLRGYVAVLANAVLTSLYLIMVKNTSATNGLTTTGMLFYNSTLSLPMLAIAVGMAKELPALFSYPGLWDPQFQVSARARAAAAPPPGLRGSPVCVSAGRGAEGAACRVPAAGALPGERAGPQHQPLHLCVHARQRAAHDQRGGCALCRLLLPAASC